MRRSECKNFIDDKIAEIAKAPVVLDVGGGERFTKWLAEYKHLFDKCEYRTMDYDDSTGADIIGDIHNIPLPNESIDAIICSSVLEHVKDPALAVSEMRRVLKKGGKIMVYVPSTYPYHARIGHYPDLWRFFGETIDILFSDFSRVEKIKKGGYFTALSYFFPMQHKLRFVLDPAADLLDILFGTEKRTTTSGYCVYAVK